MATNILCDFSKLLALFFFIKPHIALELSLAVNPTPAVKYLIVHKGRLEEAEVYEESMHINKKEL